MTKFIDIPRTVLAFARENQIKGMALNIEFSSMDDQGKFLMHMARENIFSTSVADWERPFEMFGVKITTTVKKCECCGRKF